MDPRATGRLCAQAARLLRAGQINAKAFAVFNCLVHHLGRPRHHSFVDASYAEMQALLHERRETVVAAIGRLCDVGLLRKQKRGSLIEWRRGKRWAQLANRYHLSPPPFSESGGRTGFKQETDEVSRATRGMGLRLAPKASSLSVEAAIAYCNTPWAELMAATKRHTSKLEGAPAPPGPIAAPLPPGTHLDAAMRRIQEAWATRQSRPREATT